jgi:hypothetical protein
LRGRLSLFQIVMAKKCYCKVIGLYRRQQLD